MAGTFVLEFEAGTILCTVPAGTDLPAEAVPFLMFDDRVEKWRGKACDYAALIRVFTNAGVPFEDHARDYAALPLKLYGGFTAMPHQQAALDAWKHSNPPARGFVKMPTGSGKTYLAVLAIASARRSTLVVAPTIELVQQWASALERFFRIPVGMLGGGSREIRDITVSTYDSAVIWMESIGNRFGLLIFDECHHLPGPVNRTAASMCIAPYRLGLSATPECGEEGDSVMRTLIGPRVYEIRIDQLEGRVLAPYLTHRIEVELEPDELEEYQNARSVYTGFIRANGINFQERDAWSKFIILCARRSNGRAVMNAYLKQRAIARCGRAKLKVLWQILCSHPGERVLVFTADNDAAYEIGNRLCLPVITHKTKAAERKEFLDRFRKGEYTVLVTSKVLNEGVDVPEASVGIVLSGSGSSREHVQRLGRILRAAEGKQADLYELVSAGTGEIFVSNRRRNDLAYSGEHETEEEPYADA